VKYQYLKGRCGNFGVFEVKKEFSAIPAPSNCKSSLLSDSRHVDPETSDLPPSARAERPVQDAGVLREQPRRVSATSSSVVASLGTAPASIAWPAASQTFRTSSALSRRKAPLSGRPSSRLTPALLPASFLTCWAFSQSSKPTCAGSASFKASPRRKRLASTRAALHRSTRPRCASSRLMVSAPEIAKRLSIGRASLYRALAVAP
jgi:hypothetical protein